MKHYILILAMLLNVVAVHAQKENKIQTLIRYLNDNHPMGLLCSIARGEDALTESFSYEHAYDITKDNNINHYQHQMLKDTILQYFLDASADAVACHHRKTSFGTDGSIDYALALATFDNAVAKLYERYHVFEYKPAKESAFFSYHPERQYSPLVMGYHKQSTEKQTTQTLDFNAVRSIIENIGHENGIETHSVSYRYNTQKDKLYPELLYQIQVRDPKTGEMKLFEGGDRWGVEEGGCSGTLYIFPKEKADVVAFTLHRVLFNYLHNNLDKQFYYDYTGFGDYIIRLFQYNTGLAYGCAEMAPEHIFAKKDKFGRYTVLFVDHVDSTFTLPDGYETMQSYDHGKVVHLLDYDGLKVEKGNPKAWLPLSWFDQTTQQLGIQNLPYPQRLEWVGGETFRQIFTWQWNINKDSINSIRNKLVNNSFSDLKHVESHTLHGDTIELTASNSHDKEDKFICKMYGKGEMYTASMQYFIEKKAEDFPVPMPFETRWVNDFIQQMTDSAYMKEYAVHYKYGKKSNPSSMGEVQGRLYVLAGDDYRIPAEKFTQSQHSYVRNHRNQAFHIVEEYRDFSHFIRITDRILVRFNSQKNEFQLLCIDHVDGKYLVPEEWYRIIDYKYGKKKYLPTL